MDGSAAQQHFESSQEFCCFEGFSEVVVSTKPQTYYLINRIVTDGEDQDRSSHSRQPNFPAHVQAAATRKHQVEDDQIKWLSGCFVYGLQAIAGRVDNITLSQQAILQRGLQRLVVFDQKNILVHVSTWQAPNTTLLRSSAAFAERNRSLNVLPWPI